MKCKTSSLMLLGFIRHRCHTIHKLSFHVLSAEIFSISIFVGIYKTRYWIISYMCCPRFRFPYKYHISTPNPGHYNSKSPWSSTNGLFLTLNSLHGFVSMIAVSSNRHGGGRGVARVKCVARI